MPRTSAWRRSAGRRHALQPLELGWRNCQAAGSPAPPRPGDAAGRSPPRPRAPTPAPRGHRRARSARSRPRNFGPRRRWLPRAEAGGRPPAPGPGPSASRDYLSLPRVSALRLSAEPRCGRPRALHWHGGGYSKPETSSVPCHDKGAFVFRYVHLFICSFLLLILLTVRVRSVWRGVSSA